MVTTEQLADWHRRLEKAVADPDPASVEEVCDVAKEIERAWLDAVRREANA